MTLEVWSPDSGGFGFAGWSGACSGLDDCVLSVPDTDVSVAANFDAANLVFVSTATSDGSIGGVAGGDALCATAARNVGLQGDFRAWLSTASESASARIGGSRGWVRVDGKPVADSPADLLEGQLFNPIRMMKRGTTWAPPGLPGRALKFSEVN